jgi:hypothetical protein
MHASIHICSKRRLHLKITDLKTRLPNNFEGLMSRNAATTTTTTT